MPNADFIHKYLFCVYLIFSIKYGNDLRNDISYMFEVKFFENEIKDKGNQLLLGLNIKPNDWMEINIDYDDLSYYNTYHFLKIRQLPGGINLFNDVLNNIRDDYQYLFINSHNKEYYYTMKISSYLKKCILQLYSEYYVYSNKWGENDNIYQISKLDANYTYPNLVNVEILMPDNQFIKGFAESATNKLKEGDIIQFERFGFCRLDKKLKNKLIFWFAHK